MTNIRMGMPPGSVDLIKSGERTITFRVGLKYQRRDRLDVGDSFRIYDTGSASEIRVWCAGLAETIFARLPLEAAGVQHWATRDDMARDYAGFYGERIDPWRPCLIIWFRNTRGKQW